MLNDHCIMINISHLDYAKCEDRGLLSAKKTCQRIGLKSDNSELCMYMTF